MKVTLTMQEMRSQWLMRRGYLPLRADCLVGRSDGVDLERLAEVEMRAWYLDLLATAPLDMLSLTDVASEVSLSVGGGGCLELKLPERCVRVVSVKLRSWGSRGRIVGCDSDLARMQLSPFACGGVCAPVAVEFPGGILALYSGSGSDDVVEELLCVAVPEDGSYEMDERALGLIGDGCCGC